jgi:ATP-dependent phosphofructokinase / diphosphate-dependent phosphofructokinase
VAQRHIGVLTGGGDVPGLNSAIKSICNAAKDRGWIRPGSNDANVMGILRGWKGAVHATRDPETGVWSGVVPLTDERVRTVDRFGGTFLHTSRTRPDRMRRTELPARLQAGADPLPRAAGEGEFFDATGIVIENLTALGIDALIAIGGDDTLGFAHTLHACGFPVIGIPKTMDNDVRGTEYCLGFATAISRAVAFIERQRTHLGSSELVGVFRVFGRDSGFTALGTAMVVSDLRCAIPEHPFDLEALCDVLARDHSANPSRYAMVVCSEGAMWKGGTPADVGAPDAYGHRHKQNVGDALAEAITRITGLPARMQDLSYDLRSGDPDPLDRMIANAYGSLAVELIAQGKSGRMVGVQRGVYSETDLPDPSRGARAIDVAADYDAERFRPRFTGRMQRPIYF